MLRLVLSLALVAACGESGRDGRGDGESATDSAEGGLAIITRTKYQPGPIERSGTIEGTVRLDGAPPADVTHQLAGEQAHCGATIVERPVVQQDGALGEVVVWLDDVRTGRPLPELRRIDLSHAHCQFTPRVQATVAPSTLNVLNDDRAPHRTTLTRVGAPRPFLSIPFSDNGQVVPTALAANASGIVEARSAQRPWARGYVASFDHPYFAVTEGDGRFRLDSVPTGRYTLKLWHPRGERVLSQQVEVTAGGVVTVEPKLAVR